MTETPGLLLTIIAFALVLGPLVFVHELGHYAVGRWFGVKADAFAVGFGREITGFTDKRGTRWKFGWLPLGGYVKFAGDMDPSSRADPAWLALPPEERAVTFQAKALWQRALIVAAGPITNLVVAWAILVGFALIYGDVRTPPRVGRVEVGSPAARAGIQPGDLVTTLGGRRVDSFEDMVRFVQIRAGETIAIDYRRGDRAYSVRVTLDTRIERDRFGNQPKIGRLGIGNANPVVVPVGVIEAPGVALRKMGEIARMMGDTIGQIITGRRSAQELGGPIQIAKISGEQLSQGLPSFVFLIALISINLGFINLLPIPVLDGGHLMFYAIEAVRRRPLGPQTQEWAFRGGLAAVLALMVFATFNDLGGPALWNGLTGLIG